MSIVTGTYLRYTAKGLKEDLSDAIYDVTPLATPVLSGSSKVRVKQTLHEWQTDALEAATTDNAHLEGDDITSFPTVSPSVRVGNYQMISRKTVAISGSLEEADKAGRQSELAYQMARKAKALKRDMEKIILSNQGGNAGSESVARQTATLGAWLKTNVNMNETDGGNPTYTSGVPAAARTDSATPRAFTETIAKNVMQQVWEESSDEPDHLFVGPFNKTVVSGFTGIAERHIRADGNTPTSAIAAIDVYVTDFGSLVVVPNRFQRERDAWFINFEYLAITHFRPFRTIQLAKTGDADKRMLLVEWGLKVKNEAALGLAADLTSS